MATTSGQLLKSLCGHLPPQTTTAWAAGAGVQIASRRLPGAFLGSALQQPNPALSFLSSASAVAAAAAGGSAAAAAGGAVAVGGGGATTGGGAMVAAAQRTAAAKAAPQPAAEVASLTLTKTLLFSTQTSACRRRKQMAFQPASPAVGESRSALSSSVPLSFLRARPMTPVPSSTPNLPCLSNLTPLAVSPLAPYAAVVATTGAAAAAASAATPPPAALAQAQAGRARLLAPPFHHSSGLGFWSKSWLARSRRQLQQDEQLQLSSPLPSPHALFPMCFGHWSEDWLRRSRGSLWSPSSGLTSLLSSMMSASRSSSSPTTLPPLSSSSSSGGVRVAAAAASAVASSSKRKKVRARPTNVGSSDKNSGNGSSSSSSSSSSSNSSRSRRGKRSENHGSRRSSSSSSSSSSRSSGNGAKGIGSAAADAIGGSSRAREEAAGLRKQKRVSEPQAASPLMSKSKADTSARSSGNMELAWVPAEQAAAAASADGAVPPSTAAPQKAPKAFVLRGGEHGIESTRIPNYVWNVLRALKFEGYEAYLVGGSVRDLYVQRPPKDFDVLTSASVKEVARVFKRRARIVGSRFPICHVWGPHGAVVEVSSFGQKPAQHTGKKAVGSKATSNGNDSHPHTRLHGKALMQTLQLNAAAEAVAARETTGAEARAAAASAASAAPGEERESLEAEASVERQEEEEEERVQPRIVHPRGYEWSERDTIRWIDAQRRDFTVNSLMYEPLSRTLYDYMGGLKDMKKKRINAIKPPEQLFVEDPARILRAIRLSARLRYELSPAINDYLKSDAIDLPKIISTLDRSRVTQELTNMMCYGSAAVSMRLLAHYNLLTYLLPMQGKSLEEDGTMEALKKDALTPTHFLLDVMRSLDSSAAPDKPCDAGLWLALLAFDMAFRAAPPHTLAAWAACTPTPRPPAATPSAAGGAPHPAHAGGRNEEAEAERHGEGVAGFAVEDELQAVEALRGDGGEAGLPGSGGQFPSAAVVAAAAKTVKFDAAARQQEDLVQEALKAQEDLKSRHGFDPKGEEKGASTSSSSFLESGEEEGEASVSWRGAVGEVTGASFLTSGGPLHHHHHHHHTPTYSGDVVAVAADSDYPVHAVDGIVVIADDHHDHHALTDLGLGPGHGGGFRADVIKRWQRMRQTGTPVSMVDKDEEEEIAMREDRGVTDVEWMLEEEVEVEEEEKEVEGQQEPPKPGPTAAQMAAKKMSERVFAYVRLMELQRPQVHFTKAVAAEARKILTSPFVVDFLDSGRTQPHKHEKRRTREGGVVFVECAMLALRNHKRRLQLPES